MTGRRDALRRRWPVLATGAVVVLVAVLGVATPSAGSPGPCAADPHLVGTTALLRADPAAVRLAVVGDSTRDIHAPTSSALYRRLRGFQTGPDGALRGVPARNIGAFGISGITVQTYATDPVRLAAVEAFRPTVVEVSIGLNDVRADQTAGSRVEDDLVRLVDTLHAALPLAEFLLSVPAAISAVDVAAHHYILGRDGSVNPPGAAERVTTELHRAYLNAVARLGYVGLDDVQRKVTGLHADTANPPRYLADQLHPSRRTAERVADTIVQSITGRCFATTG